MQPIVCIFCQASIPYFSQSRKYCEHLEDWHNITVLDEVQRAVRQSLIMRERTEKGDQVTHALEPTVVNRLSHGDSTNSPGCDGSTLSSATCIEQPASRQRTSTTANKVVENLQTEVVKSAPSVKFVRVPQEGGIVRTADPACFTSSLSKLNGSKVDKASGSREETIRKVAPSTPQNESTLNTPSKGLGLMGNSQEPKRKSTHYSLSNEVPKVRKLDITQEQQQQKMAGTQKCKGPGRKLSQIIKRLNSQEIEESLFKGSDKAGQKCGENKTDQAKKDNITKQLREQEIESIFGVKVCPTPILSKPKIFHKSLPKATDLQQKGEVVQPQLWYEGAPVECGVCGQQVARSHFYSRHIRTHGLNTKTEYESLYSPVPQVTRNAGEAWLCLACPGSGKRVAWSKAAITHHLWKEHSLTTQLYERDFMGASQGRGDKDMKKEEEAKEEVKLPGQSVVQELPEQIKYM